jgi:hypothetical protein
MHKLLLMLLIIGSGVSLKAQYAGYAPVADLPKFKELFSV